MGVVALIFLKKIPFFPDFLLQLAMECYVVFLLPVPLLFSLKMYLNILQLLLFARTIQRIESPACVFLLLKIDQKGLRVPLPLQDLQEVGEHFFFFFDLIYFIYS